jgi:hypothetical protein
VDISSTFNAGLRGIQHAQAGLQRNSETVARNSGHLAEGGTLETALVESLSYQHQAEASVQVVKTADETVGTLLDTRA